MMYTHLYLQTYQGLFIIPSSVNVSVDSEAAFSCFAENTEIFLWLINRSSINTIRNLVDRQPAPVPVNGSENIVKGTIYFFKLLKTTTMIWTTATSNVVGLAWDEKERS